MCIVTVANTYSTVTPIDIEEEVPNTTIYIRTVSNFSGLIDHLRRSNKKELSPPRGRLDVKSISALNGGSNRI